MIRFLSTMGYRAEIAEIYSIYLFYYISMFLVVGLLLQILLKTYKLQHTIAISITAVIAATIFTYSLQGPEIIGNAGRGWHLRNVPSKEEIQSIKNYTNILFIIYIFLLPTIYIVFKNNIFNNVFREITKLSMYLWFLVICNALFILLIFISYVTEASFLPVENTYIYMVTYLVSLISLIPLNALKNKKPILNNTTWKTLFVFQVSFLLLYLTFSSVSFSFQKFIILSTLVLPLIFINYIYSFKSTEIWASKNA